MRRQLRALRLRLTVWYLASFGLVLGGLGVVTYQFAARQIAAALDGSLVQAVAAIERSVAGELSVPLGGLHIPGRDLYLFDETGRALHPGTAPHWVAEQARIAGDAGEAWRLYELDEEVPGAEEHDWRSYARRFERSSETDAPVARSPEASGYLVAAAVADALELDDQYSSLLLTVWIVGLAALLAAGAGGYGLAVRASRPAGAAYEQLRLFAADAAHELRTPLATILTRAESTLEGDGPSSRRALEAIAEESRRLATVIDRLLVLARSEADQLEIDFEEIDLDDVLFEALPQAQARADARGLPVRVEAEGACSIAGDPLLLRHLLLALVDNAVKYSPDDGDIEIRTASRGGWATLAVADRGPGIPDDLRRRVFEPFYRSEADADGPGGVGLGLAIVRRIADAHHASVSVRGRDGGGTAVEVAFPLV